MMELQVAAAKVAKYAARESGDTLEMIERPQGGLSFVLADGQRSGRSAKAISNLVARKAIALLAEGVRDGAAARAAHDHLFTHYQGKVSATLHIVSVDLSSGTVVVSRNSPSPVWVRGPGGLQALEPSQPIGIYKRTKPLIHELSIAAPLHLVLYTDGLESAGQRYGERVDVLRVMGDLLSRPQVSAPDMTEELLRLAVALDRGHPADDISVLVLSIVPSAEQEEVRRLLVRFPFG